MSKQELAVATVVDNEPAENCNMSYIMGTSRFGVFILRFGIAIMMLRLFLDIIVDVFIMTRRPV